MRALFWILALVPLAPPSAGDEATAAKPSRPNIVLILADDLGYGDVRILNPGTSKIPTPHLDKLAGEGMAFMDAHSASAVCTPTRYALLTGRYAWRTRLQAGVFDGGSEPCLIAPDRLTVAGLLRAQGYRTACIGKWHLGFQAKATGAEPGGGRELAWPVGTEIVDGPLTRGFDLFYGCSNARTMSSLFENHRVVDSIQPVEMLPRLARRAVGFIREQGPSAKSGSPFFLYLPLTSPHTPIVPTAEWKGKSGMGAYADFVMQTDAVVGEVLAALEVAGVAGETLVIFSADNGCSPLANPGALARRGHAVSGPLRGLKTDLWEGGHRVPLLLRWPGVVKPGSRSAQVVGLTDLMATLADQLGVRLPDNAAEDSRSFLPLLRGKEETVVHDGIVHHSIEGRFAIREGRWKLLLCRGSGGQGSPREAQAAKAKAPDVQLYDLEADLGERRNLQAEHPEVVARLRGRLQDLVSRGRSTPGGSQPNDVPVVLPK